MSLIAYLISLVFTGLIVGALARLLLPGRDPMSIPMTIGVGLAGSFLAGLVSLALFNGRHGGGIVMSVIFALLFVFLLRRSREKAHRGHAGTGSRGFGL